MPIPSIENDKKDKRLCNKKIFGKALQPLENHIQSENNFLKVYHLSLNKIVLNV
jgi:hypothetical protein